MDSDGVKMVVGSVAMVIGGITALIVVFLLILSTSPAKEPAAVRLPLKGDRIRIIPLPQQFPHSVDVSTIPGFGFPDKPQPIELPFFDLPPPDRGHVPQADGESAVAQQQSRQAARPPLEPKMAGQPGETGTSIRRNICTVHHMHKVWTTDGRSWHCRRTARNTE